MNTLAEPIDPIPAIPDHTIPAEQIKLTKQNQTPNKQHITQQKSD